MNDKPFPSGASIAIVGAGIIGVASAFELSRRGYQVTVYDDNAVGEGGPSRANAGHIVGSDIHPLSTPGIHRKALRMLMNADAPLKIPLRDSLAQIPWFWRFWRTSQGKRFLKATQALSYLSHHTLTDVQAMFKSANMADKVTLKSCAFLYDTNASFNASQASWAEKMVMGIESDPMTEAQIRCQIPLVSDDFKQGVLSHNWAIVSDPLEVVQSLAEAAKKNGVEFKPIRVENLRELKNSVQLQTTAGQFNHDGVIISAGVHSKKIAQGCGDFLPVTAERGYNITLPTPGEILERPLVFADRGIVATQLTSGLRIGGWAEYAPPHRPANQAHFKSIARISAELFPRANFEKAIFWMGSRPSMPDSVPVISKSAKSMRIFYNCGHGHYGLSFAASSARIVSDMISGENVDNVYQHYSIQRF
ncbi:MAG: D-amino-acid dehydrogenase [Chitinophagales bacterium]|jgi:D-amino-acid dehydrogenase